MIQYYKRGWGDRYDGWRLRNVDGISTLIPYILRTRLDSQCFFEETVDAEKLDAFVRMHRAEIPGLTVMHVIIAAMVRIISQRPYTNRFVVHNKLYAHNDIRISLVIKRELTDKGEETPISPVFEPASTLADVVRTVNDEIDANMVDDAQNGADSLAKLLAHMPAFLLRFVVNFLFGLDNIGWLPKAIHKFSPWHASAYLTNVGSLGIGPVYHHLSEFGTCSFFIAMGKKNRSRSLDRDGEVSKEKTIGLRIVVDERVCDGHYYALTMRYLRKLLNSPETLLSPPARIIVDDGVGKPLLCDPNDLIPKPTEEAIV